MRKRVKRFGKADQLGKVLAGKTFLKGKPFEVPAAQLADVGPDPDLQVVSMVLTYTRMKGDLALFDVTMKVEREKSGTKMKLDFKGKVELDPKINTPIDTRLEATLTSTGASAVESMKNTTHRTRWARCRGSRAGCALPPQLQRSPPLCALPPGLAAPGSRAGRARSRRRPYTMSAA